MNAVSGPTIGVFDSGFGGLTVLRALIPLVPGGHFVYLGDTARLPYGSKSQQTVARYALSSAHFLVDQGAELLVVACNTATALALEDLQQALSIPVVGVIQPGAEAAAAFTRPVEVDGEPTVLVLATTATVQSHAYLRALQGLGVRATEKACPLLVPLVEEGWIDHPVTAEVLRIYLTEALVAAPQTTALVLGCTHYPLLQPLITRILEELRHPLHIIDAAQATARAAAAFLPSGRAPRDTTTLFYATDSIDKFQHLGSRFLGHPLPKVHLLDLGG